MSCPFDKDCKTPIYDDAAWTRHLASMPHNEKDPEYEPGGYPHPERAPLLWKMIRQRLIEGHKDSHRAEEIMSEMARLFREQSR